jgi:hypothetical protein
LSQRPRVSKIASSSKEKRTSRPSEQEEPAPSLPALSPHPNALKAEAESDMSSGIRPSRRRGAVVSYAEPNLRDKMRRPTKEMIDAVALGSRRSSSFQPGRDSLNGEDEKDIQPRGSFTANFVSAEQNPDVSSQDGSSEQLMAMVSRRKRKVSSAPKDDVDSGNPNSGLQKEIENSIADTSAGVSQDTSSSRRQTRRHSSNPKSTSASMAQYDLDLAEPPSPSGTSFGQFGDSPEDEDLFGVGPTASTGRGQRVAARRKSMMV